MKRNELLSLVYSEMINDPTLFSDIVIISQQALIERATREADMRSEAYAAILTAYPFIGKKRKLAAYQRELINRVVLKASEGTEFGEQIRDELGMI